MKAKPQTEGASSTSLKLADMRDALEVWHHAAADLLLIKPGTRVIEVDLHQPEWQDTGQNFYLEKPKKLTVFTPATATELRELDSYKDLEDAAHRSSVIGPLFGQHVGSHAATHEFDFWEFASAAIPTPIEVSVGRSRDFNSIYADLEQGISDSGEYVTLCFLQGIKFNQERIDLAPGLFIEGLTSSEITDALTYGLLQDIFGPTRGSARIGEWNCFALRLIHAI